MVLNEKEFKAVRVSIEHWEKDIRGKLLQGDRIKCDPRGNLRWGDGSLVQCYAKYSALCRLFLTTAPDISCNNCPYYKYHGTICDEQASVWFEFVTEPTLDTCNRMIDSLKALLAPAKNSQGNKKEKWSEFRVDLKSGAVVINLN